MSDGPIGRCPHCSKPSLIAPANAWRPFCSERCKLIDLGDWMEGRFVIPVAPSDEFDELADYGPDKLPRQ
ncbi:MAG: DNA gyrase inhibitor YacG [Pseudomonadota bacterium]